MVFCGVMVFLCFVFLWWCGDVCGFCVCVLCFRGGVVVFLCDGVVVLL